MRYIIGLAAAATLAWGVRRWRKHRVTSPLWIDRNPFGEYHGEKGGGFHRKGFRTTCQVCTRTSSAPTNGTAAGRLPSSLASRLAGLMRGRRNGTRAGSGTSTASGRLRPFHPIRDY